MTRRNVTKNSATSFEELSAQLLGEGFDVDHFHAMEVVQGEEMITHVSPDGDNSRCFEGLSPQGWDNLVADEWHDHSGNA